MRKIKTSDFLNQIHKMILEVETGRFFPILESDVMGFLYHLLISYLKISPAHLHLDTRICDAKYKDKYDLVYGKVSKRKSDGLYCIDSRIIVEAKMFPKEFSDQQHNEHFLHVVNGDLEKLRRISYINSKAATVELLYDERDYLTGKHKGQKRLNYLLNQRKLKSPTTKIILAQKSKIKNNWTVKLY